jgi:hypothetical protein
MVNVVFILPPSFLSGNQARPFDWLYYTQIHPKTQIGLSKGAPKNPAKQKPPGIRAAFCVFSILDFPAADPAGQRRWFGLGR